MFVKRECMFVKERGGGDKVKSMGGGRMCKCEIGDKKIIEKKRGEEGYVIAYVDKRGSGGKEGE